MKRFLFPTAFNVAFAFIVSLFGLYYTAKSPECFTTCGWPIQFVTQIPVDSTSVKFAIHWIGLIIVWLSWYIIGCLVQEGFRRFLLKKS